MSTLWTAPLSTTTVQGIETSLGHRSNIQSDTQGIVTGAQIVRADLAGYTNTDATQSNAGGPVTDIEAYYAITAGTVRFPDYTDPDNPTRVEVVLTAPAGPYLSDENYIGSGYDKTHLYYQLSGGTLVIVETYGDVPDPSALEAAGKPFFFGVTTVHPQDAPPFLAQKLLSVVNRAPQLKNPVRQIGELASAVGAGARVDGLLLEPNADLTVDRDAGKAYLFGGFPETDMVSTITVPAELTPIIAKWAVDPADGTIVPQLPFTTSVDPTYYDAAGTLTAVPAGRWWQIMTLFQHHDDESIASTGARFGTRLYRTKESAILSLGKTFPLPPASFKEDGWYVVAFLVISSDATDLTDSEDAVLFDVREEFIGAQDAEDFDLYFSPVGSLVDSATTVAFTIYHGQRVGIDTTAAAVTVTIDATTETFRVWDAGGKWHVNNVTVTDGVNNWILNQKTREIEFVYDGAAWRLYRVIKK